MEPLRTWQIEGYKVLESLFDGALEPAKDAPGVTWGLQKFLDTEPLQNFDDALNGEAPGHRIVVMKANVRSPHACQASLTRPSSA